MEDKLIRTENGFTLNIDHKTLEALDEETNFLLRRKQSIIQNYLSIQTSDLLKTVGDNGAYQKMVLIFFSLLGVIACFIAYELPFIFFPANFYCSDSSGNFTSCSETQACSNEFGFRVEHPKISLVSEFEIYCGNKGMETHSKSFIFFFAGIIVMVFSFLCDVIGRTAIFYISWVICLAGCLLSYVASDLKSIVVGMGLSLAGIDLFYSILFIYSNEVIGSSLRSIATGIVFAFYGLGGMIFVLVNVFIYNYKVNFLLELVFTGIIGCGFFLLCETPFFLYKKMKLKKLYNSLEYILKWNHDGEEREDKKRKLQEQLMLDDSDGGVIEHARYVRIETCKKSKGSAKESIFKLVFTWKWMSTLIFYTIVLANIYLGYGLSLLIPGKLGIDNIYINGILMGGSEMLGYILSCFNAHRIKRKTLNILYVVNTFVISGLLLSIQFFDLRVTFWGKVCETGLSVVLKLFIAVNFSLIFTYGAELFPTKIRGVVSTWKICSFALFYYCFS